MYQQLTEEKRLQIWAMRKEGKNQSEIAKQLHIHRSTVSRELNRNSGPYGYEPQLAQQMAAYRKKFHQQIIEHQYEELITELIKLGLSTENCKKFVANHHPELSVEQLEQLFNCCQQQSEP
ncbi:helix-turn-helix domain-containing protein [Vibrio sp. 404]|uniref:Helix-turn-helix domain-containing protein n=1 Tax=Vibrio marinisediminis TaxID=2758441 RepID=A0A7W2FRW5_9VIBR|nr:helix-turn-helix domain-containing protein [Vibrio marinisediminis]MBA5763047.1 helix-turn-helix domain-containing protein [Vibrio marinisediminis]